MPDQLAYGRAQIAAAFAGLERMGLGEAAWAVGDTPGAADCALVPMLVFCDMFTTHFGAGPLLVDAPGAEAYWTRASAEPLGRFAAGEMGKIVPTLLARRAAAA